MAPSFLTSDQVILINKSCLVATGEHHAVIDRGKLDSAVARPQFGIDGKFFFPTIPEQGAVLAHALIANHPFEQGNKRTAYSAMQTFLTLNTHILLSNQTHAFHFITRMAMGKVSTEEAIEWVKKRCESF